MSDTKEAPVWDVEAYAKTLKLFDLRNLQKEFGFHAADNKTKTLTEGLVHFVSLHPDKTKDEFDQFLSAKFYKGKAVPHRHMGR